MMSTSQRTASSVRPEPHGEPAREELCGNHIGDRRVRVQRQPRTVSQKLAAMVRRTLSR